MKHLFPGDANALLTYHFLLSSFSLESRFLAFYLCVYVGGRGGGGKWVEMGGGAHMLVKSLRPSILNYLC